MTVEYQNKDFLWVTQETSGSLLLGTKTQEEIEEEQKDYALNKILEDEEAIDLMYRKINNKQ